MFNFVAYFFILILEFEKRSGGDLVNIEISRFGSRESFFNIKCVLPAKLHPTNTVRLFLLLLPFSFFGCC